MAILNPITNAGVLAIDGNVEPEARLQGLLRLWLGNYFAGIPFTTRAEGGTTTAKTFIACDFLWQDDVMPLNAPKPVLHVVMTADGTERMNLKPGVIGHRDRWLLEVTIKLPGTLDSPEYMARRLAGQVLWLFSSSEREALSVCGVEELNVEAALTLIPVVNGWHRRMMMASCATRREQSV